MGQQAAQALSWTPDSTVASEKAEPLALDLFFPTIKWSQQVSEALLCIKPKAAGVVTYLIHDLRAQSGVRDTHFQGNGNSGAQDTESFVRN